jgi:predicted aconitase with swiveling domain
VTLAGEALTPGQARGMTLVLDEPISFWGGVDENTGRVTDTRHPQSGASVAGTILVLQCGRGSSSSSSVLAECLRNGVGPAAIVLAEPDPILALGALVAGELYGTEIPVVVVPTNAYAACSAARELTVEADHGSRRAVVRIVSVRSD